jgi:hypothetical protein
MYHAKMVNAKLSTISAKNDRGAVAAANGGC